MSEIQHANPFGFDPIPAYELFTGRSKVIDEIEYYLNLCNKYNKFNLLIVGPSGSGKTSLLNYIKLKMEHENIKLLFVEIDLMQSKFKKDVTLFKQILDEISYKINIKPSICQEEFFDNDFINISASRLRNCFEILSHEARNQDYQSIILIFDDSEFLRTNRNLLSTIKLIFSRLNGYNLVFLGIEDTKGLLKSFSPVPIELNYFENKGEVKSCITAKLKDHERNLIDDNVYDEIFKLTKGCPRLVMLFAHYLYRKYVCV